MADEIESARIQVFGADPRHAELEARELREVLKGLDGAQVHFAPSEGPRNTESAKGPELLPPELVLVLTTGTLALARTAIRA